ncbi:unnamed protein product [Ceutorhynchus assimilis]|uniref:Uncharacterized protein n=1 Tax=Ceutorhynchus assimilis TaxID=467358 RepID=A0A9N9MIA9_9CUCU|nr:unnamed protein product [Ceutorhynchus assimilis]
MFSVTKKNFSIRTLKEHLELLIKLWLKELKNLKNLSGIDLYYIQKKIIYARVSMSSYVPKKTQKKLRKTHLFRKNWVWKHVTDVLQHPP